MIFLWRWEGALKCLFWFLLRSEVTKRLNFILAAGASAMATEGKSWFFCFVLFIFITWRLITLQYCSGFCHTLTWISHGFTYVPHRSPLLPPSPSDPSGSSQCTSPEHLSHASKISTSLVAQLVKNPPAIRETWIQSLGWEEPWKREWLPTPVFLTGEFYGQRSLAGYSPWGLEQLDMTEWLFTFVN